MRIYTIGVNYTLKQHCLKKIGFDSSRFLGFALMLMIRTGLAVEWIQFPGHPLNGYNDQCRVELRRVSFQFHYSENIVGKNLFARKGYYVQF